jgi:DNA-binding PadR family transcriptional regulator
MHSINAIWESSMSIKFAILVALSESPKSGYDVAKHFDQSIGFFWRARHSQIYRELGKLRDKGWAVSEEMEQSGKPNRIVFTITSAGREALLAWSREPTEPMEIKDDFLVQLYGIENIDMAGLRANLSLRLERHRDRHTQYATKHRALDGEQSLADLGHQLALEVGIRWEQGWVDWCTKALERLAPEAIASLSNVVPLRGDMK